MNSENYEAYQAEVVDNRGGKKVYINKTVKSGITFGSCLAMVISYFHWHSIFWAIVHGILGWIYVIYYILKY